MSREHLELSAFRPQLLRTATGYGLAASANRPTFIEFFERSEAMDAFCLLEDTYRVVHTIDGAWLAQALVDRDAVVAETTFSIAYAALIWVEEDFIRECTRQLIRYSLTDEAIQQLADLN